MHVFRSVTVIVVTVIGRSDAGILDSVVRLAHENGLQGGGSERELGVRRRQRQHAGAQAGVAVPRVPLGLSVARDHDRLVQGRAQIHRAWLVWFSEKLQNRLL